MSKKYKSHTEEVIKEPLTISDPKAIERLLDVLEGATPELSGEDAERARKDALKVPSKESIDKNEKRLEQAKKVFKNE